MPEADEPTPEAPAEETGALPRPDDEIDDGLDNDLELDDELPEAGSPPDDEVPDEDAEAEPDEDDDAEGPLLDLSALAPVRPHVRIKTPQSPDGELYEMAVPSDLGAVHQQYILSRARIIEELMERNSLSANERQRLKSVISKAARLVLPAEFDGVENLPAEVFDQLPDIERQKLVTTFFVAYAENVAGSLGKVLDRVARLRRLTQAN